MTSSEVFLVFVRYPAKSSKAIRIEFYLFIYGRTIKTLDYGDVYWDSINRM